MVPTGQGDEREDIERELERHATDEERQRRGSTPSEDILERALQVEPGFGEYVARARFGEELRAAAARA